MLIHHVSVSWNQVTRSEIFSFDLENTPLQIKTDTLAGSEEKILFNTYTADKNYKGYVGGYVGSVEVYIYKNAPIRYYISTCTSLTNFQVKPPEEADKIWTFRKNTTTLSIDCNGVEVLNYHFSDSKYTDCEYYWGGDIVERIKFSKSDTASDGYREKRPGN